ncbi:GDSL-type esterase/lipase family protein [Streptomyces sp. NPDC001276]|uniref:SGNH/GDSL hydrolase family protein n=1 Tax=Streptomyces sp. NPDC001276 TaxID=3364555 RepID=UPI0036C0071B
MRIQVIGETEPDAIEVDGNQPGKVIEVTNSLVLDPIGRSQIGVPGGVAGLDESGTVPDGQIPGTAARTATTARAALGVYVPPGWGARWRSARDAAATGGKARMITVGDSITHGFYASNLFTTSWVGIVRNALQAQFGNGGLGYFTSMNSRMAGHNNAISTAWENAGCFVTSTGTWTQDTSSVMGPGIFSVDSTTVGSTVTFPARGSSVKIYTITGTSTRAGYTYSIDGGASVSVADSGGGGAANIQVTTVTGLSTATHTVKITHTGTAGQKLSVCGVGSENNSGIIVDNVARSGSRSAGWAVNTASALNAVWNGGSAYPGDLVVYSLGVNDANVNNAGDEWAANVAKYLKAVRDAGDGSTDLLILMHHVGKHEGTNVRYQDYVQRARGLADAYGAALVDMWAIGRNSWNYWDQLGYWADVNVPGAAGHDTVHLSDAGHQRIAEAVLPILTA